MPGQEPEAGDTEKLEFAFKLRSYHHNAIWEEQKHFTWMISILLSAILIATTSSQLEAPGRAVVTLIGSVAGILLAITGFRVQRREGEYFRAANSTFVSEHNKVFADTPISSPDRAANRSITELITAFALARAGIRDYFQALMLFFAAAFLGLAAYAVASL